MLPKDFPPYNLVYYYFSKWKNEGVFDELFFKLHIWLRIMLGCAKCPSLGLIDSRSVKTSHHVDRCRGIDGNKKIKGRKQHLVVDTLGIPLAIVVHEANIQTESEHCKYLKICGLNFLDLLKSSPMAVTEANFCPTR